MGRNTGTQGDDNSARPIINTVLKTGEAVERGDVLLLGADDNLLYVAALPSDSPNEQILRPISGGAEVRNYNLKKTDMLPPLAWNASENVDIGKLKNGNVVLSGISVSGSGGYYTLMDADGGLVSNGVIAGARNNIAVAPLANGGFALGYALSTGAVAVTVFDSKGAIVTPQFVIDAGNGFVNVNVRLAQITNGNLVAIVRASNLARLSIATTAGVTVKAATVFHTAPAGTSGERSIALCALAGGGFVAGWLAVSSDTASTTYTQRFDDAGASLGAASTLLGTNNATQFVVLAALANGGYAAAVIATTSGDPKSALGIYSAAGVLQGAITSFGTPASVYYNAFAMAAGGGADVVVGLFSTSGISVQRYSALGAQTASRTLDAGAATAGTSVSINPDNTVCVTFASSTLTKAYLLDAALADMGEVSIPGNTGASVPKSWATSVPTSLTKLRCITVLATNVDHSMTAYTNLIRRQRMTFIGVANNAAAANADVSVQLTGMATPRRAFLQPYWGPGVYALGNTMVLSDITFGSISLN